METNSIKSLTILNAIELIFFIITFSILNEKKITALGSKVPTTAQINRNGIN